MYYGCIYCLPSSTYLVFRFDKIKWGWSIKCMMKQYRILSKNIFATKCGVGAYVCICMYMCIRMCICIYMYVCVCVYVCSCIYICVCVCVCVCLCVYVYLYIYEILLKTVGNTGDNHSALVRS